MATKFIPPLPQTLFHGTQKLHSEISGKGPELFTQVPHLIAGDNFSAFVWSSSPMPRNIQVIVDGEHATTPASFNEPATKADSTCPNTSSKISTESTSSSQSSSNKDDSTETASIGPPLFVLLCCGGLILVYYFHQKGRERGARDLKDLIPEGKIFTEREGLLKKEEWLKEEAGRTIFCPMCGKLDCERNGKLQNQRKALAERIEALDRKELQQLRQRTSVLEGKLERQKASIETDRARESPVGILPNKTHMGTIDGRYSGTADLDSPKSNHSAATREEMGRIKRAEETPKSRERELETQRKDREKRIQELILEFESRKSDRILRIASGMLLGSALAYGVTKMISVVRN